MADGYKHLCGTMPDIHFWQRRSLNRANVHFDFGLQRNAPNQKGYPDNARVLQYTYTGAKHTDGHTYVRTHMNCCVVVVVVVVVVVSDLIPAARRKKVVVKETRET